MAAISIGLGFLLGGPFWGFVFLFIGIVILAMNLFPDEQLPTFLISDQDREDLQTAANRRKESEIRLQQVKREEYLGALDRRMDAEEQKRKKEMGITNAVFTEDFYFETLQDDDHESIREVLRRRDERRPHIWRV